MTDRSHMIFRLFDEGAEIDAAMDGRTAEAVVTTDSNRYRLHAPDRILQAAASDPKVTFHELEGWPVAVTPSTEDAASNADVLLGGSFIGLDSMTYIEAYIAPSAPAMGFLQSRWRCEPHGEVYVRASGGRCPKHLDGELKQLDP